LFGSVLESDCYRDIKVAVFVKLGRQLEIAKIEEIKNIPINNVLDPARPPVTKSYPTRRSAALAALALSLVLGVTYAGLKHYARQELKGVRLAIAKQHRPELDAPLGNKERLGGNSSRYSKMFFRGRQQSGRSLVSHRKEDDPKGKTFRGMPALDRPPGLPDQIEIWGHAHLAYSPSGSTGMPGCCFSCLNCFEV
jgi:hypothetical protein